MAPKLKLVYFKLRGQAECIRLLLHFANVEFEDKRIEFAEWTKERENAPNQKLPYIEYQGRKYGEALPIIRFLARKYRLLGKDELEQFECDILISQVDDLRSSIYRFKSDSFFTDVQKRDLEKEFQEKKLPEFLEQMEDRLQSKTTPYLIGASMSFADILIFELADWILAMDSDFPEKLKAKCPLLYNLVVNVSQVPQLRTYLDERPETLDKDLKLKIGKSAAVNNGQRAQGNNDENVGAPKV